MPRSPLSKANHYLEGKYGIHIASGEEAYVLISVSDDEPVTGSEFGTPEEAKKFVDDKWEEANEQFMEVHGEHLDDIFNELLREGSDPQRGGRGA